MKRMIVEDIRSSALVISDMLAQVYENYSDDCGDIEMYDIADDHIDEWAEPCDQRVWDKIEDFVKNNYSLEDLYNMSPSEFAKDVEEYLK